MFDGRFRSIVDRGVGPIGSALGRTGLSPDHLTTLGLIMAVPAALAIGTGHLMLGLVLLALSAIPDLLDGALAKASGTSSKRGAFFDSVADRVTDAIVMGGVAWYLQSSRGGHAGMLAFAILGVSTLISYERAKAELLGFTAKGGLMERAERIILLCVGLFLPVILVPILWAMLVLTAVTAVQRFAKVWRQATAAGVDQVAVDGPSPAAAAAGDDANRTDAAAASVVVPAAESEAAVEPHVETVVAAELAAPLPDATAAMAERGRAWRIQAAGRDDGDRMAPAARPWGTSRDANGVGRSSRWEERRAARLRADSEDKRALRRPRRRHSTRRP